MTPLFSHFWMGELSQEEAFDAAGVPMKEFMAKHTREADFALFIDYAQLDRPEQVHDIPLRRINSAFAISELKTAFQMGFMIFVPFLVIDMIVASILCRWG